MKNLKVIVLVGGCYLIGCTHQSNLQEDSTPSESKMEAIPANDVSTSLDTSEDDSVFFDNQSVIFYTPNPHEIPLLADDPTTREGLIQAVGDFAYYASIVSDSLEDMGIPVHFTNKRFLTFAIEDGAYSIDRLESGSPIGLVLYDGVGTPENIPGMQTHLSLLATITDRFSQSNEQLLPLLDYFEPATSSNLHIFSSHSDILNQTGNLINPAHYSTFGQVLATKASKFRMSVFAYQKFDLEDSLQAIICRVPSRYDESAIKLYIWDPALNQVADELELAENVWNEQWIMVKDSWISINPETGTFSVIQRKIEASMKDGTRKETDNLYRWNWSSSGFESMPVSGISKADFPLKDWDSHQEPSSPQEITLIDENYVWLPLSIGDLTWENLALIIPQPYSIEKEPVKNPLALQQIDTLVTISRPGLRLKFYRSPTENLIVDGTISDRSILFKQDLQVGMSKAEFANAFEKLPSSSTLPDLVKVCSKNQDRILSYYFQNDTLTRIEVMNFIY